MLIDEIENQHQKGSCEPPTSEGLLWLSNIRVVQIHNNDGILWDFQLKFATSGVHIHCVINNHSVCVFVMCGV